MNDWKNMFSRGGFAPQDPRKSRLPASKLGGPGAWGIWDILEFV